MRLSWEAPFLTITDNHTRPQNGAAHSFSNGCYWRRKRTLGRFKWSPAGRPTYGCSHSLCCAFLHRLAALANL
jgi:hypothetical protein